MKIHPVIYIVVGAVALGGALFASYINITLSEMAGYLGSAEAITGTDTASLQETASALSMIIMLLWVWIASVIAASALCIYTGVSTLRSKRK
jgi:hypothetical protein